MTARALPTAPVLHSEWIKIRSLRGTLWALVAILAATCGSQVLMAAMIGPSEAARPGSDPLRLAFHGVVFGQIAAIAFGAKAVACEFHNGALRTSLGAVPNRTRFYVSKIVVIGALALVAGQLTAIVTFVSGQALMGERALESGSPGVLRAVVGSGLYLALMVLFAAGLTAVLRSGTAVLSLLIPFVLLVSFVIGDHAGGLGQYLPDRAGQLVLSAHPQGDLGPWAGLGVEALWAVAALVAGGIALRRRDA
ncbi:ABC transporter permease [Streptomyces sp. NPDC059917]|uniref:ABC transporter permease n=1 Tax=Streptomyces sp. NPDC059917 TaxID=3347002 RepID=UPI003656DDA3